MNTQKNLDELRKTFIKCLFFVGIVFLSLFSFSKQIYQFVAEPLLQQLPQNGHIIATTIISPFFAPLKLTFFISIFISIPFLLWQVWSYLKPALLPKERTFGLFFFFGGTFFFYLGVLSTYCFFLSHIFKFFINQLPKGTVMMIDLHHYIDFVVSLSLAIGFVFETPMVIFLLIFTGIMSYEAVASKRKYIFVGCFIISILLAPPEVICQLVVTLSIYAFVEISLYLSKLFGKKERKISDVNEA